MKKLLVMLCVFLLILTVYTVTVLAEVDQTEILEPALEGPVKIVADDPAPEPEPKPTPGEPMTWEYLATIAGATAATLLIVQFLKVPLDKVWKIPTRAFVYIIALLLLLGGTYFTSGLTVDTALLTAVNAVIVALAAYGTYEITFKKLEKAY